MNITFNFSNNNGDFILHVKDGETKLNYARKTLVTPIKLEVGSIEINDEYQGEKN